MKVPVTKQKAGNWQDQKEGRDREREEMHKKEIERAWKAILGKKVDTQGTKGPMMKEIGYN